jgi:hypothetical protein
MFAVWSRNIVTSRIFTEQFFTETRNKTSNRAERGVTFG